MTVNVTVSYTAESLEDLADFIDQLAQDIRTQSTRSTVSNEELLLREAIGMERAADIVRKTAILKPAQIKKDYP